MFIDNTGEKRAPEICSRYLDLANTAKDQNTKDIVKLQTMCFVKGGMVAWMQETIGRFLMENKSIYCMLLRPSDEDCIADISEDEKWPKA